MVRRGRRLRAGGGEAVASWLGWRTYTVGGCVRGTRGSSGLAGLTGGGRRPGMLQAMLAWAAWRVWMRGGAASGQGGVTVKAAGLGVAVWSRAWVGRPCGDKRSLGGWSDCCCLAGGWAMGEKVVNYQDLRCAANVTVHEAQRSIKMRRA